MIYNNKSHLAFLKKLQLAGGISLLLAMTAAILLEMWVLVLCLGILLVLLLILMRVLNFNFVRMLLENDKLIIRYYALYTVERNYESVEFPAHSLRKVVVKKYLFGLKWDLRLTVRLKQGLASYPPICLSAIPLRERKRLVNAIKELVRTN